MKNLLKKGDIDSINTGVEKLIEMKTFSRIENAEVAITELDKNIKNMVSNTEKMIIKLREEVNPFYLNKSLGNKADLKDTRNYFESLDSKITCFDNFKNQAGEDILKLKVKLR